MFSRYRNVHQLLPQREDIIIVVDIQAVLYRYFFAAPRDPDAMLRGCVDLITLLLGWDPITLIIAYDQPGKTWRHRRWSGYKNTRKKRPPELDAMLPSIWRFIEDMGVDTYGISGYEADDVVASLTRRGVEEGMGVIVVSWDKDLACLVGTDQHNVDNVVMYRPAVGAEPEEMLDVAGVIMRYGVEPEVMQDWLSLAGDSTDNIPGCKGIGDKRARDLLQIYGTLDRIIEVSSEVAQTGRKPKKAEGGTHLMKVYNDLDNIMLSRELVRFKYPYVEIRPWMKLKLQPAFKFLRSQGLLAHAERILHL